MTEPVHIRVVRPYQSTEEFLATEAWSVTARSLLLINVDAVAPGTPLRCELCLANGQALIVAEGTAVKHADATPTRPAGLVVRYKRMSSASSDFVKLAVARAAETRTASSPTATEGPFSSRASNPPSSALSRASSPAPKPSSRAPGPAQRPSSRAPGRRSERPHEPNPHSKADGSRADGSLESKSPFQPQQSAGRGDPQNRRSSRPAARDNRSPKVPSERKLAVAAPRGPSKAPTATPSRGVSETSIHDSTAMQRLRNRRLTRAISSPPDREGVLARLKRKSER